MLATVHAQPSTASDTLATLSGWEYNIYPKRQKSRAFLVGFSKYGEWGLPILAFSPDSHWARTSVELADSSWSSEGWVDLTIPETRSRIWADFLPTQSLRLKSKAKMLFYSRPSKDAVWNIKVVRDPNNDWDSYILAPIRREGRWLLVDLFTPYSPCAEDAETIEKYFGVCPRRIRVWIEYIDEQGRPLVGPPGLC